MQKLLEGGTHLIVDRYVYSGIAYSAAKGNRHLTREWCSPAEQGLLAPDAVFFLQVDAAAAKGRCVAVSATSTGLVPDVTPWQLVCAYISCVSLGSH